MPAARRARLRYRVPFASLQHTELGDGDHDGSALAQYTAGVPDQTSPSISHPERRVAMRTLLFLAAFVFATPIRADEKDGFAPTLRRKDA